MRVIKKNKQGKNEIEVHTRLLTIKQEHAVKKTKKTNRIVKDSCAGIWECISMTIPL